MEHQFITKDGGQRNKYASGMMREPGTGKPRFALLIPEGVPYEAQFLTRCAELLVRGAEKYEARNWERADGEAELADFRESAFRHFMQWLCGARDEDHAAAVVFNLLGHETTLWKMQQKEHFLSVLGAITFEQYEEAFSRFFGAPNKPGIADDVWDERDRQLRKRGMQERPNGTDASKWHPVEIEAKRHYDQQAELGELTWVDILHEEVAESFAEEDPAKLRVELIQVMAVAASWIQDLDRRAAA